MHEGLNIYTDLIEINWTMVMQIINTIIIFLVLRHFLFHPVREFMLARQAAINNAFADAELKKLNADTLTTEYQSKLEGLSAESREIVKEAKQKADAQANDIIEDARQKAAAMIKRAEDEIERDKQKAINELKDQISIIAISVAEKILEKELTNNEHDKMIDKLIQEAGNSTWQS